MASKSIIPFISTGTAKGLVLFLLMALLITAGIFQLWPPAVAPATAGPGVFSAERAMAHVRAIAGAPRPVGSEANATAREYILGQLRALGLSPEVQEATGAAVYDNRLFAARATNIVVRMPGAQPGKAVALMGHYDSQPITPGAADDGAAVAAILETLRALKSYRPLPNDVIAIFTDAEEFDAAGSEAFVAQHPWLKDIGLIVNLEAGGDSGPAFVMQTSAHSATLARDLASAAPLPMAYSFTNDLFKIAPAGTDFGAFRNAGVPGFDIMFFNNRSVYHTVLDNPNTLDPRSLQHQGSYALALALHYGSRPLESITGDEAVFFTLFGRLIVYPQSWALPLAVAVSLALLVLLGLGFAHKRLGAGRLAAGFGLFLANLLLSVLLGTLAAMLVLVINPELWRQHMGAPYNTKLYLAGFLLLLPAVTGTILLLRARLGLANLAAGAALGMAAFGVLSAAFLPGFSYLFVWPLLFALLPLGRLLLARAPETLTWPAVAGLALAAAPGLLLFPPLIYAVMSALGLLGMFPPALPLVGATLLFAALLCGLLVPQLAALQGKRPWAPPAAAALAAVACLGLALALNGWSARQPEPTAAWYTLDADTGQAYWVAYGDKPDVYTDQFFKNGSQPLTLSQVHGYADQGPQHAQRGPAPVAGLPAPVLTVTADTTENGVRNLKLHMQSPRGARGLHLELSGGAVSAATVDGRRFAEPAWSGQPAWHLLYYALPARGIDVTLALQPGSGPLTLKLTDQTDGLPTLPGVQIQPRPADMMPLFMAQEYMPYDGTASVGKTYAVQ